MWGWNHCRGLVSFSLNCEDMHRCHRWSAHKTSVWEATDMTCLCIILLWQSIAWLSIAYMKCEVLHLRGKMYAMGLEISRYVFRFLDYFAWAHKDRLLTDQNLPRHSAKNSLDTCLHACDRSTAVTSLKATSFTAASTTICIQAHVSCLIVTVSFFVFDRPRSIFPWNSNRMRSKHTDGRIASIFGWRLNFSNAGCFRFQWTSCIREVPGVHEFTTPGIYLTSHLGAALSYATPTRLACY